MKSQKKVKQEGDCGCLKWRDQHRYVCFFMCILCTYCAHICMSRTVLKYNKYVMQLYSLDHVQIISGN